LNIDYVILIYPYRALWYQHELSRSGC